MAIAPVIGSYICFLFHWRGNFVLLLILGIISLILGIVLLPTERKIEHIRHTGYIKEDVQVFKSSAAIYYILTISLIVLPYWVFAGFAPILYINDLNVNLKHFGLYQGSMTVLYSFMSISNQYFIKKFGEARCITFSFTMLYAFCVT